MIVGWGTWASGSATTECTGSGAGIANARGVSIHASDWVVGKYKARFTADQTFTAVYGNDDGTCRIHMLGNTTISNSILVQGVTFWHPFSMRWLSWNGDIYAGHEIHASGSVIANGPAPFNQGGVQSSEWVFRVRGAADSNQTGFNQWTFGRSPQGDDNGSSRQSQDFNGLTSVITANQWVHFMEVVYFHSSSGWYELWACTHGNQMVNVVPRKYIQTCYAPPSSHYPMISMYYQTRNGTQSCEYAAGAYATTEAEARAHQVAQIGYDMWGGGAPADQTAPTVPTNLAATSTVPTEVDLSWTASTDAVGVLGYQVWRNGLLLNAVLAPTVSYADTNVTAGTTYSYTVRAYDAAGNFSAQTAAVQVTTPSGASSYDALPANWMGGTYAYTGTTAHGSQSDKQRCYKVTATRTGSVTHIGHYREPAATAGTETVKLAVWPDNGSGTDPGSGAMKGQTAEITFTSASATGRYSTALTAPFAVTSGDILWVGELNGGQGNIAYVRKNTVAGVFRLMPRAYASGLTTWDTAADATYDLDMTIWLEGTESPPATAPVYVDSFVTGTDLTVFYDKTLAAVAPLGEDFAVTVDAVARQVTTVSVADEVVTLTLASPVSSGQTVELSYTQVTGRELQDSDANLCANLTTETVTNNTPAPFPARVTTTARVVASGRGATGERVSGLGGGV